MPLKLKPRTFVPEASLASLLFLAGCGGGSFGKTTPPPTVTGSLSASPTSVTPGEAVTLTWTSQNSPGVYTCNFLSTGSNSPLNGSVVDHPTVTQSYQMTINGNGQLMPLGPATVTVAQTGENYVLVENPGDPNGYGKDMATTLSALTTQPINVQTSIPTSVTGDALVVLYSTNISPADVPKVTAYLQAGKGVVLVGLVPRLLATGDSTNEDVSAISSWLGGSDEQDASGAANCLVPKFVPVPLTLIDSYSSNDINAGNAFPTLNTGADPVAGVNPPFNGNPSQGWYLAYGYKPAIGGRLFWAASSGFAKNDLLLSAAARWAANGVGEQLKVKPRSK